MAAYTLDGRAEARSGSASGDRAVALWLYAVAALVFLMVVVGGATRLTDSGLSLSEWKPILGAIPPLDDAAWQAAFDKYKQIPQAQIVNKHMTLAEFKVIYAWEWGHRLLGRLIGVVFALPLVVFWATGRLRPGLAPKLVGLLVLGGLQGFVGWIMVQSGLVDRIDVSPYRLALHLTLAAVIFALLFATALRLGGPDRAIRLDTVSGGQRRLSAWLVGLVLVQFVAGALVAGNKAGRAYNTWPLMDGHLIPDGVMALDPWYRNIFENLGLVQVDHRFIAYALLALVVWHFVALLRSADDERVVRSSGLLAAAMLGQLALGVWTVVMAVPLHLGLAHQAGAMVVLALAVWHRHRMTALV